jgi:HEPN domain-containing protein
MDIDRQIEYWTTASDLDWKTAIDLFESGKNFHFCLFICHLSIEKYLKALVVKETHDFPPKIHNLLRLADITKLETDTDDIILLESLNKFQMDTRYPDEKFTLYKIATKEFTSEIILKVDRLRQWLITKTNK